MSWSITPYSGTVTVILSLVEIISSFNTMNRMLVFLARRTYVRSKIIWNGSVRKFHLDSISTVLYQRVALASVFPTLFLVHAALSDDGKKTSAQSKKEQVEQGDVLYDEMKYVELYELLYPERLSGDDNILWRLARATYELSLIATSKEKRKSLGEEAHMYIKKAIEINNNNHNVHRWSAIIEDYVATMNGTKERILKSTKCREHIERAIEICSSDATSHHMLGVWCYMFADLPWYQRKIAAALFASPPESSFEEALLYFEKAEKLEPNFYSQNLLMLGKTYLKLKETEKAITFLQKTKNYPSKTKEDYEAAKEADDLLKYLNVK